MNKMHFILDRIFDFCEENLPLNRKANVLQFFLEQQILPYLFEYSGCETIAGYDKNTYSLYKVEFAKRRLELEKTAADFINRCEEAKQKFLILKGFAFEDLYYPKNLLRNFSDIDILVDEQFNFEPDKRFFDAHLYISDWPLKSYLDYRVACETSQIVQGRFGKYHTLSDTNNFLLMISHGTKHHWCRLRWILDLVWYLNQERTNLPFLDELKTTCRLIGMETAMKVALILASRFIDKNHMLHSWLKSNTSIWQYKLAKSITCDLVRKRKQNIFEKLKNILRSLALRDSAPDKIHYLIDRIYIKKNNDET